MDALNKAEQAKRQSQAADAEAEAAAKTASASPSPPLTLELTPLTFPEVPPAVPVAAEPPPALPELPTHLGVLDEEFIAHAAAPKPVVKEKKPPQAAIESRPAIPAEPKAAPKSTPPAPAPARKVASEPEEREAAQNLFDAKQNGKPASKRRLAIAIGVISILAGAGIGIYFWLQLKPSSGLSAGIALPSPAARPPAQPAPQPPAAAPVAPPAATEVKPPVVAQPARPANVEPAPILANEPAKPIRLSASSISLNPALSRGYEAYMAGNLGDAQNEYQQVLKTEAANLDALHGMAAIKLRLGQAAAAEEYYLRAIEADPKDALATAGLIGLKGKIDPLQAESRLKTLLAAQPELPYLNFALGNLYASQNRWQEAQEAYFKAYNGEPDNPDTLFNLAISLDRLHQPKLAYRYYSLALAAAESRPSNFDKTQLNIRLRELQ